MATNSEMLDPRVLPQPRRPWKGNVSISDLLTDDDLSKEQISELGKEVARRLQSQPLFQDEEILEDFEDVSDEDEFNYLLGDMYSYCDNVRIWVN